MAKSKDNNNLRKKIQKYTFDGTGLTRTEKRWGRKQFKKYKKIYHIEKLSDLELLNELVWRETIQKRYKIKIGELSSRRTKSSKKSKKKRVSTEIVPQKLVDQLNNNLSEIIKIKTKLGLFNKEDKKKVSIYKHIKEVEKRFENWADEHVEERTIKCPFCKKLFVLNIRTDKYKASKLKLFKNKILCNDKLWNCFKIGKITKDDMAKILNVAPDYVSWLEKKIYNLSSKDSSS